MMFFEAGTKGLILEELIKKQQLEKILRNKKVGFYTGAFDPLHKGHEEIVKIALAKNYCDFVIIYPSWGGGNYKNLTNINLRHEMVFSVYASDPRVIVTRLPPEDLQKTLTIPKEEPNLVSPIENIKFIGIVGSDNALKQWKSPSDEFKFMGNNKIPPRYFSHFYGELMAIPAEEFIVAVRNDDNLAVLNGKVSGRQITAIIEDENTKYISSTLVKNLIKKSGKVNAYVSKSVAEIILENDLYKNKAYAG